MAKLDLNLPPEPAPRRGPGALVVVGFLVSLATLALVAWSLFRPAGGGDRRIAEGEAKLLLEMADRLERRTLHGAAADVLARYIRRIRPTGEDLARSLYRRGRDLMLAGRHEEAAGALVEAVERGLPEEERRRARQRLLDCYSALGKHAAREDAARAMAEYGRKEEGGPVARLLGETISAGELLEELGRIARAALAPQMAVLPKEAYESRVREEVHARLRDEKGLEALAQRMLAERVLFREALERKLDQGPEVPRAVERFRRAYLAERVVRDAILDLQVTALDVKNHFEAHREDFAIPEAVRIAAARFEDRAAAEAALEKKEIPFEPVEGWIERGGSIPGIGRSAEVEAQLFALPKGGTSDRPIEAAGAFHLFRVEERRDRRIPAFEEVRDRVEADLVAAKRKEAVARLQAQLALKFQAEVDGDAIRKLAGKAAGKAEAKGKGKGGQEP